jgi:hypothetical protein
MTSQALVEEDDTLPHFIGYGDVDDTVPYVVVHYEQAAAVEAEWRYLLAAPVSEKKDPVRDDVGVYLKRYREASGITLEEVSRITKIGLRTLTLLEEARLDELPARVFVIGYITAFARVVGCAPSEALARLSSPR